MQNKPPKRRKPVPKAPTAKKAARKTKAKPQNHVLYVRDLQKPTIEALEWAKKYFDVGSNAKASITMIDHFPALKKAYESEKAERRSLENRLQELETLISQGKRLQERIENYFTNK